MPKKIEGFDPEGVGYDYEAAKSGGLSADETGHWPSRNPKTGQILKGKAHPTFHKTVEGEKAAGYEIYKKKGNYFSRKIKPLGKMSMKEYKNKRTYK